MDFLKNAYNVVISNPIISNIVSGLILAAILWIFRNYIKRFLVFIFKWLFNSVIKIFSKISEFFKWLWGKFQCIITTISGSKEKNATLKREFEDYKTEINSTIKNYEKDITKLKNELKEQVEHFNKKIESLEGKIKEGVDKVEENKKTRPVVELREPKKEEDFHDTRNGLIYKTTIINNKIWFAEDLNYFAERSKGYIDRPGNTYNWETAMASVPLGWHIPSQEEWLELIKFAGGKENAGKKLKAKEGWSVEWFANCNGTDDFGFAALPYSKASSRDNYGWWSSTERGSEAFVVIIENDDSIETRYEGKRNSARKFVRCVKD
jgi:uncharacterized protein (TIGR02145 family)